DGIRIGGSVPGDARDPGGARIGRAKTTLVAFPAARRAIIGDSRTRFLRPIGILAQQRLSFGQRRRAVRRDRWNLDDDEDPLPPAALLRRVRRRRRLPLSGQARDQILLVPDLA